MRFEDWFNEAVRGQPPRPMTEEERHAEARRTSIAKMRAQMGRVSREEQDEEIIRLVGWADFARYGGARPLGRGRSLEPWPDAPSDRRAPRPPRVESPARLQTTRRAGQLPAQWTGGIAMSEDFRTMFGRLTGAPSPGPMTEEELQAYQDAHLRKSILRDYGKLMYGHRDGEWAAQRVKRFFGAADFGRCAPESLQEQASSYERRLACGERGPNRELPPQR